MSFTEYEGLDFSYLKSILFQNWYRKEIVKTLKCNSVKQKIKKEEILMWKTANIEYNSIKTTYGHDRFGLLLLILQPLKKNVGVFLGTSYKDHV